MGDLCAGGYRGYSQWFIKAQLELSNKVDLAAVSFDEIYRQIDGSLGAALRPSINLDYL